MDNITIKDIARLCQVSCATVSRALNDSPSILPETKQKILTLCREVGYEPNALARNLVKKNTSTIGFVVPDASSPFYAELIPLLEDAVRQRGYHTLWCTSFRSYRREEEYFDLLIRNRVEGVIICPVGVGSAEQVKRCAQRLPTVLLGDALGGEGLNYVCTDNLTGGRIAGEYLWELGHERLVFAGMRRGSSTRQERLDGFLNSLKRHGLSGDVLIDDDGTRSGQAGGYEIFRKFLQEKKQIPSAVFAATDSVALGVLEACEECGLKVPEDLSLIGFDNITYSALPRIRLTTIEQNKKGLTETAVRILFELLGAEQESMRHETLPPALVKRSSCAKFMPPASL